MRNNCPKLDRWFVVSETTNTHNYKKTMQNMNTQKQNGYMLLFRSDEWYEEPLARRDPQSHQSEQRLG